MDIAKNASVAAHQEIMAEFGVLMSRLNAKIKQPLQEVMTPKKSKKS